MTDYAVQRRPPRPKPLAHPNGWWGMAIFSASEAMLFGALLGTYYYLRFKAVHWPPAGTPEPKVLVPLVLTAVLVATSVPMQAALRAAREGRLTATRVALAVALAAQATYFGSQIHLFLGDLAKFTPGEHAYGSIYFTLLGAHHAHVLVGLLLDGWLLARLVRGLTAYRVIALRAVALYWYVVSLVGVAVVLTQVSPS